MFGRKKQKLGIAAFGFKYMGLSPSGHEIELVSGIGVNATGVAEVATPQYLTCRGRPVLTTPHFDKCFIFFPSAELLNTASRCHFHLQCAQCTVFNSTFEQNSLRIKFTDSKYIRSLWRHGFTSLYRSLGTNGYTSIKFIIQLQSVRHMNLKNNTPRCTISHHFEMKNS